MTNTCETNPMSAKYVFGVLTFGDAIQHLKGHYDLVYCIPPAWTWNDWIQVKVKNNSEGYWVQEVRSGLGKPFGRKLINQRVALETSANIKGDELHWIDEHGDCWRLKFTVNKTVQLDHLFME